MPVDVPRKVKPAAVRLRRRGARPEFRFGANTFVAVMDAGGGVVPELHGIARGPNRAKLRVYSGLIPFQRELIRGERFDYRTGCYERGLPHADLSTGADHETRERLR